MKKKPVRRKLTISSDESDIQDRVQALGDPETDESKVSQARQCNDVVGVRPVSDSPLTSDESANESAVDLNEVCEIWNLFGIIKIRY